MPSAGADRGGAPRATAPQSVAVTLGDPSGVGEARRTAGGLGARARLSADELANLSIVVNELAGNALRHGGGGTVVFRTLAVGDCSGVEVLCIDGGPGMSDVTACFRDGYSTGGTMGTGLGAARRLAHAFDIFSAPGQGTVVLARMWAGGEQPATPLQVGALAIPVAGEHLCGDGWALVEDAGATTVMLVDGLGHGAGAAVAAQLAIRIFRERAGRGPVELVELLHQGLRPTRGAAAAVAEIRRDTAQVRFAGIGNIAARIISGTDTRSLVSHNGIVGVHSVRAHEFTYPFPAGASLVLHSDGVTSHWKADSVPGLFRRDPAIAAGIIYRDFARGRDDASIVVCRYRT